MTSQAHPRRRVGNTIAVLAWVNVALHVAGLALAAVYIRPGSPLVPLADRLAYLAASQPGWTGAWVVWAACATVMVGFSAAVCIKIRLCLGYCAFSVAVLAATVDLTCDYAYIFPFPIF